MRLVSRLLLFALFVSTTAWGEALPPPVRTWSGDVLLIGDSMMKIGLGASMKRSLAVQGIASEILAKSSTGLTRDDVFSWPKATQAALGKRKIGATVVMLGTNDCQPLVASGRRLSFGSDEWQSEYGKRVDSLLDIMCAEGRKVLWIGLPPMQPQGFDRRIRTLNSIIEQRVVARGTCAAYVPLDTEMSDGSGRFTLRSRIDGRVARIRSDDGIHFTAKGGEQAAASALFTLARL